MDGISRIIPRSVSVWSVVGTVLLLSSLPPARAASRQGDLQLEAGRTGAPCVAAMASEAPALSAPPAGAGSFRPTHFSVASVIVAVERIRVVTLSRIGGLYGP